MKPPKLSLFLTLLHSSCLFTRQATGTSLKPHFHSSLFTLHSSVQRKCHPQLEQRVHRLPVQHSRLEHPLLHGVEGWFVEHLPARSGQVGVADMAAAVDHAF